MKIKHVILLFSVVFALNMPATLIAQQVPHYTQYTFNDYMINPGVTGSKGYLDFKLGYRTQWIGIESAPKTMFVSAHMPFNKNKKNYGTENHEGAGFFIIRDKTGPFSRTGAHFSYAYHIKINRFLRMALGVSLGLIQYNIENAGMTTVRAGDPAVIVSNSIAPDGNTGIFLYSNKYYAGLAIQQFLPLKISGTNNKLNSHFLLTGGYVFKASPLLDIIPSAKVELNFVPVQIEATVKGLFRRRFWLGVTYRKIDAIAGIMGFWVGPVQVGYAYDYGLSRLHKFHSNTHEIIIGFKPPKSGKKIDSCPTFGISE